MSQLLMNMFWTLFPSFYLLLFAADCQHSRSHSWQAAGFCQRKRKHRGKHKRREMWKKFFSMALSEGAYCTVRWRKASMLMSEKRMKNVEWRSNMKTLFSFIWVTDLTFDILFRLVRVFRAVNGVRAFPHFCNFAYNVKQQRAPGKNLFDPKLSTRCAANATKFNHGKVSPKCRQLSVPRLISSCWRLFTSFIKFKCILWVRIHGDASMSNRSCCLITRCKLMSAFWSANWWNMPKPSFVCSWRYYRFRWILMFSPTTMREHLPQIFAFEC